MGETILLRSLIVHGLAIVTATIILPILAAWILGASDLLTKRYYYHLWANDIVENAASRSPFHSAITTSMLPPVLREFKDVENRTIATYDHNHQLSRPNVSPYVIPPISIASDEDADDEWTDDDDEYWGLRHHYEDAVIAEGLASLRAAEQFRQAGKEGKAQRLFDHALSLAPTHPDVLAQYGLFAEESKKDLVIADYYYVRALLYSPEHALARLRRRFTLPLVRDIDTRMFSALDKKRQHFFRIPRDSDSFHAAARDAYIRHIFHTVAIEGNTMTLTQTRSILETRLAIGGKSVIEHNEILGVDAALRYINSSLVYRRVTSLTVNDVLEIHRRVLGFVDPIEAGRYRRTQVYVGRFEPPAADEVPSEMNDLMAWVRAESTLRDVHPVEIAALLHYKLVAIHPFVDGNGRTARLLMNLILMQAGFPPVVIRFTDRKDYYETLKVANDGDLRPFVRFIARCTDRTLDEYLMRFTNCGTTATSDVIMEADEPANIWKTYNSNSLQQSSKGDWSRQSPDSGEIIDLDDNETAAMVR